MRIRLVRHGAPEFNANLNLGKTELSSALDAYAKSDVVTKPSFDVLGPIPLDTGNVVVSSNLVRAKSSASLLKLELLNTSTLLNEAKLPHPDRLPFQVSWKSALIFFRIAWLLGYRKNSDGIRLDLKRAELAADWLIDLAYEHGEVIAFGHGIMHRLIYRKLSKRGWTSEWTSGGGHWSCRVVKFAAV